MEASVDSGGFLIWVMPMREIKINTFREYASLRESRALNVHDRSSTGSTGEKSVEELEARGLFIGLVVADGLVVRRNETNHVDAIVLCERQTKRMNE